MAAIDVDVLRVFTDANGRFGNPLGVVDGAAVPPDQRQAVAAELGYSETVFVDDPASGRIRIFTPATELPFAGHPTVGTAWWLRDRGYPGDVLEVPAGKVSVTRSGDITSVRARAAWAPEFQFAELPDPDAVLAVDPAAYPGDHDYIWAWRDQAAGELRSRMFASVIGIREDEATGSAAVRLTVRLGRDLRITQGTGSQLRTTYQGDDWAALGGRVVHDTRRTIEPVRSSRSR